LKDGGVPLEVRISFIAMAGCAMAGCAFVWFALIDML